MLIENFDDNYLLGVAQMDDTHREFAVLVNRLGEADKDDFIKLFDELVSHTEAHFEAENALMREYDFPAIREHMGEHERVLGELHRIAKKVAAGSTQLARAYVREHLPGWFNQHAATMDSALAAWMKHQPASVAASAISKS